MKSNANSRTLYSTKTIAKLCVVSVLVILVVPTLRNTALYFVWPLAWREMGLTDVIAMRFLAANNIDEVAPLQSCPRQFTTSVQLSDLNRSRLMTYPGVRTTTLRQPGHAKYLPAVSEEDKVSMLYLYLVLADALRQLDLDFFLVSGSLLGVYRHRGLIPWDDDLDITVSLAHWKPVQERLSCIEGFALSVTTYMHWKFYHTSSLSSGPKYPFVDIFFYTENANFVWAVSRSAALDTVFAKKDTFPLTTCQFEGLEVPVPKNLGHVVNVIFQVSRCQSPSMKHKSGQVIPNNEVVEVPCHSLSYLYPMYHLDAH